MHKYKGLLIVTEGPDGSGKGAMDSGFEAVLEKYNLRLFNAVEFQKKNRDHPQFDRPTFKDGKKDELYVNLSQHSAISVAQPSYAWAGTAIRRELLENSKAYSAIEIAQAYADDRLVLDKRVIMPALEQGKLVLESRNVLSSLTYQPIDADLKGEYLTREQVLNLVGNKFEVHEVVPDLLVICDITEEQAADNLKQKGHLDNFELDSELQRRVISAYKEPELLELFTKCGTELARIEYDSDLSVKQKCAADILEDFLKSKGFLKNHAAMA